jgi:hypothetical protein
MSRSNTTLRLYPIRSATEDLCHTDEVYRRYVGYITRNQKPIAGPRNGQRHPVTTSIFILAIRQRLTKSGQP